MDRSKKNLDKDHAMLANRVKQLKNLEQRMLKKIDRTRLEA